MFKPKNYSKVMGNDWLDSDFGEYVSRGDFIDPIKQYHEWQENQRWWNDYSKNTGLDLQDIAYPYRSGYYSQVSGEAFMRGSVDFMSSNILKLYKW